MSPNALTNVISLSSLTPREAIQDAILRCVMSLDNNDAELFNSSYVADGSEYFKVNAGDALFGRANIWDRIGSTVGPMDTCHMVTNWRIDVKDGADTAIVVAYALAQHKRPGEGKDPLQKGALMGNRYDVEVVKDKQDGVWKCKRFDLTTLWADGDFSILPGVGV